MKKKLGEILVTTGAVTGADVDDALREQSAGEPSRLGDLLVASGKLTASQLAQALAEQHQLPYVDLPPLPQAVLDLVPMELQRQFRFVPLRSDGTELHVAMADLANLEVIATLEQSWTKVHVSVASGDEIDALHATLSGLFAVPAEAPPASHSPTVDELFGSLELDPSPPVMGTALDPLPDEPLAEVPSVSDSAVMRIASAVSAAPMPPEVLVAPPPPPVLPQPARSPPATATSKSQTSLPVVPPVTSKSHASLPAVPSVSPVTSKSQTSLPVVPPFSSAPAAPAPAPHLAEDLFSDLNLESARTGISARPPAEPAVKTVTAPLGLPTSVTIIEPPAPAPVAAPEPPPVPWAPAESSGPVLVGVPEGTGPLLDMLAREGTGPVVDTPFFNDALAGPLVPTLSDAPFVSSRSSVSAVAVTASPAPAPPPPPAGAAPAEELPEWLRSETAAAAPAPAPLDAAPSHGPQPWTGALDHLMPSKLVVGLTRALLARGLVTEEEILAALGQKK